jgi:hypothetical protein
MPPTINVHLLPALVEPHETRLSQVLADARQRLPTPAYVRNNFRPREKRRSPHCSGASRTGLFQAREARMEGMLGIGGTDPLTFLVLAGLAIALYRACFRSKKPTMLEWVCIVGTAIVILACLPRGGLL